MSFSPSGRFKLLDAPPSLPGKCAICGYAASGASEPDDRRQYIDFNLDIDYYGAVYFCTTCINELATELGYALPAVVDEIKTESEQVKAELMRLSSAVEVIDGIAELLVVSGWIGPGSDGSAVDGESQPEAITFDTGADDSESVKSVDESGSDDVRDIDESDEYDLNL